MDKDAEKKQGAIIVSEKGKEKDDRSRKRKILEAATGTTWGAKSYSAAKISLCRESGSDPGYDDFGRYFAEKQRKLREQYHQDSSSTVLRDAAATTAALHGGSKDVDRSETPSGRSNTLIFQGVSIFVDGFTIPTHQELRFIMMNNGGVFENYFSRQRVTHIICTTLPDNKIMNPRMLSRGLPIVKPEWIVESMKANKLLPWEKYQLERIAYAHPGQQTIAARFAVLKDISQSTKAVGENPTSAMRIGVKECSVLSDVALVQTESLGANQEGMRELSRQDGGSLLQEETEGKPQLMLENSEVSACLGHMPSVDLRIVQEKIVDDSESDHTSGKPACDTHVVETVHAAKSVETKAIPGGFVNRPFRSSLNDTDFVKNFFKNSRLHFIGTWRTRYQSLASSFGKDGALKSQDRQLMEANSGGKPMIIHLDMDCFFVSVVVRNRPDLVGKPVAVCHSDSEKGTAEISSANYPARSHGITAGMYVRSAKSLCPELKIVSYDFAGYEEVADKLYNILHRHCTKVEAVSCDEAFLDVTGHPDPVDLASRIREEIYAATRCSASAGIAENLLLARLATKRAKPNGQYSIKPEERNIQLVSYSPVTDSAAKLDQASNYGIKVRQFMSALPVEELPGVGWALQEKLHSLELYTCADLLSVSKDNLQKHFGTKTGNMLWNFAQGIDNREVHAANMYIHKGRGLLFISILSSRLYQHTCPYTGKERKSIGAEVNWGVRFESMDDAEKFLVNLSDEVASRLQCAGTCGRTITLKIKKRKVNAGEPEKYLGHGPCDSLSRSETLGYSTNSADVLLRIGRQLYSSLHIEPEDVRGMGLQVSRLESTIGGSRKKNQALDSWLAAPSRLHFGKGSLNQDNRIVQAQENKMEEPHHRGPYHLPKEFQMPEQAYHSVLKPISVLPQTNEVKTDESSESREREFVQRRRPSATSPSLLPEEKRSVQQVLHGTGHKVIKLRTPPKGQKQISSPLTRKVKGKNTPAKSKRSPLNAFFYLPPVSRLPQQSKAARKVSFAVAEQGGGSVHKKTTAENKYSPATGGNSVKPEPKPVIDSQLAYYSASGQTVKKADLVDHRILQQILEWMSVKTPTGRLSSHLLSSGCYLPVSGSADTTGLEKLIQQCVKVLAQYVRGTVSRDLEEVHLVLLYMKRLGGRCKLWKAVEELASPAFKDIIGEHYGGHLAVT